MGKVIQLRIASKTLRTRPIEEQRLGLLLKGVFAYKDANSDEERKRILAETNSLLRRAKK